jgi:spore maturation protein CgeB
VEIPACGGFMLAERTAEHLELFDEGLEAEFFASDDELIDKCRRYLGDEDARGAIARRGHERCIASGYSNAGRLRQAFGVILGSTGLVAR